MSHGGQLTIGLLYYQDDKYPEAIQAYKQVIASYPGSEELVWRSVI